MQHFVKIVNATVFSVAFLFKSSFPSLLSSLSKSSLTHFAVFFFCTSIAQLYRGTVPVFTVFFGKIAWEAFFITVFGTAYMLNIASIIIIAVTGTRYFNKWMLLYFSWNGRRGFLEEISNTSCYDIFQCKCNRGTCQSKSNTMLHLSWKTTFRENLKSGTVPWLKISTKWFIIY